VRRRAFRIRLKKMTTRTFEEMILLSRPNCTSVLQSSTSTFNDHVDAQQADASGYASEVLRLIKNGVELPSSTLVRAAALCWRVGRRDVTDTIMVKMKVVEVLALVRMLDADRQLAQISRKLDLVTNKSKRAKLHKVQSSLEDIRIPAQATPGGSATRSLMKRVRKWVGTIEKERLEFFLLNFGLEPWRQLADLAHLKPEDFQLDYFLHTCFGKPAPEGSLVYELKHQGDPERLVKVLATHPQLATCYSYVRSNVSGGARLSVAVREAFARVMPLVDVIWFYEELDFVGLEDIVDQRMLNGETLVDKVGKNRDSFGKVMERLLFFRKHRSKSGTVSFLPRLQTIADDLLKKVAIPTNANVAVFGDASSSMQIAVNSATIIGSIVCSALSGHLSFFNHSQLLPTVQPRTVADVLRVTTEMRASGATAPAAALLPFLHHRTKVDLFIVVTDEEENTGCSGEWGTGSSHNMFAPLFKRYLEEVNPRASCFFVSFLAPDDKGQMMKSMNSLGLSERCKQFRFHPTRPDLSKVNALLAALAAEVQSNHICSEPRKSCETASLPVMCMDGPVLLTEIEMALVDQVLTNVDSIPSDALLQILPSLRLAPAASDCQSVTTEWSIVDKLE